MRECKTKAAFLEEKKAMLQIELAREKKKNNKKYSIIKDVSEDRSISADEDKSVNVTVHTKQQANVLGCFPFGGKSTMAANKVQKQINQ